MLPRRCSWAVLLLSFPTFAHGQMVQRSAEYWLPAEYNYAFYENHNAAARSFYAAHFAHFRVYEEGLSGQRDLEQRMAALATRIRELIADPPRFEPPIDLIAPEWTKIAYRTGAAMDWTHHLHEQLYDILADDDVEGRLVAGQRAISHYLANEDAAFSTRGYGHAFMLGGGTWAGEFAGRFPDINGILWAYHWHHAAIYEALMEADRGARTEALDRVLRTFRDSVLVDLPTYMPLTAQVAPEFSAMFPAAAHIFDNLHMMHDVVNDVMVTATVPAAEKGSEIERLRQQMSYRNQAWVIPPMVPAEGHGGMPMDAMRVPTLLPDGRWLPQGHPDAAMAGHMNHGPGGEGGGR